MIIFREMMLWFHFPNYQCSGPTRGVFVGTAHSLCFGTCPSGLSWTRSLPPKPAASRFGDEGDWRRNLLSLFHHTRSADLSLALHLKRLSVASLPHSPSPSPGASGSGSPSMAGRCTTRSPSTSAATSMVRPEGEGQAAARLGVDVDAGRRGEGGSFRQGGEEGVTAVRGRDRGRVGAATSRDREAPKGRRARWRGGGL